MEVERVEGRRNNLSYTSSYFYSETIHPPLYTLDPTWLPTIKMKNKLSTSLNISRKVGRKEREREREKEREGGRDGGRERDLITEPFTSFWRHCSKFGGFWLNI